MLMNELSDMELSLVRKKNNFLLMSEPTQLKLYMMSEWTQMELNCMGKRTNLLLICELPQMKLYLMRKRTILFLIS
jgi:hypothetical protein